MTFGQPSFGVPAFGVTTPAAPSAVPDLRTLWLNDAADPGDCMAFAFMASLSVVGRVDGQVRAYAGGRQRVIRRASRTRGASASLPWCTRVQVAWLEAHVGRVVWVRDHVGRKFAAVYFEVPVSEHQFNAEADVDLALVEVTASEVAA